MLKGKQEPELKTPRGGASKLLTGKGKPGDKKDLKKIPAGSIKKGELAKKEESGRGGKGPISKAKIQASRFNKPPAGGGLKKSPSKAGVKTLTRKDSSRVSLGVSFE